MAYSAFVAAESDDNIDISSVIPVFASSPCHCSSPPSHAIGNVISSPHDPPVLLSSSRAGGYYDEEEEGETEEEDLFSQLRSPVRPSVAIPLTMCLALSPLCTMIIFMSGIHNAFVAMFFMHWVCMTTLPCLYLLFIGDGFRYYRAFWRGQKYFFHKQWRLGMISFILFASVVFGLYLFVKCDHQNSSFCTHMKAAALDEGFKIPMWLLFVYSVYFTLVNPVIEEFFWRIFLYRELGSHLFIHPKENIIQTSENAPLLPKWLDKRLWKCNTHEDKEREGDGGERQRSEGGGESSGRNGHSCPRMIPSSYGSARGGSGRDGGGRSYEEKGTTGEGGWGESIEEKGKGTSSSSSLGGRGGEGRQEMRKDAETAEDDQNRRIRIEGEVKEEEDESMKQAREEGPPLFSDIRLTFSGKVCLSILYASYHFVVFVQMIGVIYGVVGVTALTALGLILIWMRNHPKLGILSATLAHAGVDFGAVIALVNVFVKFI